jgi:hypothetical protein
LFGSLTHSELIPIELSPHTNGQRAVHRCGALSLLQKTPSNGDSAEFAAGLKRNFWDRLTLSLEQLSQSGKAIDPLRILLQSVETRIKHETANRIQSNLRARLRICRWASAVTRRPTPKIGTAGARRSAPLLRELTCHSAGKSVDIDSVSLHTCLAGPPQAYAEDSCRRRRRHKNCYNLRRRRRIATPHPSPPFLTPRFVPQA